MTSFHTRHGLSDTRIHRCWMSMRGRCERPTDRAYANYGGRGIKVCDRWQTFENFLADMGPMPEGGTIERIDVNKGYAPENCRWATKAEQSKNTRRTRFFEHEGRTLCLKDWAREAGIRYETLRYRVMTRGMPIGEALRAAVMTASEAAALGAEARWGQT